MAVGDRAERKGGIVELARPPLGEGAGVRDHARPGEPAGSAARQEALEIQVERRPAVPLRGAFEGNSTLPGTPFSAR